MKIQYLGHSCFVLTFGSVRIATDPFGDIGIPMPKIAADVATVSHAHYDHCNTAAVSAPLTLSAAGNYRAGDVSIVATERFHDEVRGRKRGKTLVFRFESEGLSVVHLGDLGEPCSREVLEKIGHADILLIPVGGNYTIGAAEAKKYVDAISPAVAIPMHYYVEGLKVDIGGPQPFLSLFKNTERAGSELIFEKDSLGAGKIILMEREENGNR